jgi:predicted TIM-barrel fold metal-dependent hydrolase
MKIIDAQVHIWSKTVTPTTGLHRKVETFTAEQLLMEMDEAGVDAALIHPPGGWDPDSNALAVEAAQKYPRRFAVMGQFALDVPDNRGLIHGWRNQPGMLGLRWPFLQPAQRKLLDDGAVEWLWPAAEKEGLPLAMMGGMFLPKFRAIAERHPNLRLLIDHCGLNRHGQDGLHRIFDAFGPKRMFWGTDITRMPCSYRQCVTLFTEELSWLRGRDLDDVMGRGLCQWIGWDCVF